MLELVPSQLADSFAEFDDRDINKDEETDDWVVVSIFLELPPLEDGGSDGEQRDDETVFPRFGPSLCEEGSLALLLSWEISVVLHLVFDSLRCDIFFVTFS